MWQIAGLDLPLSAVERQIQGIAPFPEGDPHFFRGAMSCWVGPYVFKGALCCESLGQHPLRLCSLCVPAETVESGLSLFHALIFFSIQNNHSVVL